MIPKSNVKLIAGDYCLIRRTDGALVAFAYLGSVANSRSSIYGALLEPVFSDVIPSSFTLSHTGMVNIKCYKENNTPIIGNALEQIGVSVINSAVASCTDMSVGSTHRVIGHKTLIKLAESISA